MNEPAITQERHVYVHEYAAINDKKKLRTARGIVYSILFAIPFWLIIIMILVWLV